jgi:peroxiredoxin
MEKRQSLLLRIFIFGPLLALSVAVFFGYLSRDEEAIQAAKKSKRPLVIGISAPDFTYPDMEGKKVSLSEFRGKKVVFVNVWATWCPPCIWEMPSMETLYKELKPEGLEILAVSIDALGTDAVRPFLKSKVRVSFPILLDPRGTIKNRYRTTGVPESFIVNRKGIFVSRVIGPRDWSKPEIMKFFRSLLAEENGVTSIKKK